MKRTSKSRSLTVQREVVRVLSNTDLAEVGGGDGVISTFTNQGRQISGCIGGCPFLSVQNNCHIIRPPIDLDPGDLPLDPIIRRP